MRRSVTAGGHELRLTSLEQSLLYLMAANAGRLLTRDEILDHLWGIDYAARATSSTATCGICGRNCKTTDGADPIHRHGPWKRLPIRTYRPAVASHPAFPNA